jgi:hypothetical protein
MAAPLTITVQDDAEDKILIVQKLISCVSNPAGGLGNRVSHGFDGIEPTTDLADMATTGGFGNLEMKKYSPWHCHKRFADEKIIFLWQRFDQIVSLLVNNHPGHL